MDLKEIKKLCNFARKAGVKSISFNGLSVEFKDEIIIGRHKAPRLVKGEKQEKVLPAPPALPSLDEINQYIYGQNEEAG